MNQFCELLGAMASDRIEDKENPDSEEAVKTQVNDEKYDRIC